jgi:hypothetical protein
MLLESQPKVLSENQPEVLLECQRSHLPQSFFLVGEEFRQGVNVVKVIVKFIRKGTYF